MFSGLGQTYSLNATITRLNGTEIPKSIALSPSLAISDTWALNQKNQHFHEQGQALRVQSSPIMSNFI